MQQSIHPVYKDLKVTCSCGESFTTRSTLAANKDSLHIEICSQCHPFFTGKQKLMDTSGRIDRFKQRYAAKQASTVKSTPAATKPAAKAKPKAKKN